MSNIHPSSIVDPAAEIGAGVEIGPFCTVGPKVKLGDGCRLISHVVIEGKTTIGKGNVFYPFSIIGPEPQDKKYRQEETCLVIGDGNQFRESVSVHVGTVTGVSETRIGNNNLLMGYVHIAHDCVLGDGNVLANYVGLSGHVVIDDHVTLGGQVGVVQFLRIGSYSFIGGGSVIDKNIPPYSSGYGNRIEIKGVNIVGLRRYGLAREKISAILDAHKLYFRSDLSEVEALQRVDAELGDVHEVKLFIDFIRSVEGGVR
jgi:UDP-N-acetylglucosamine acyltransferase